MDNYQCQKNQQYQYQQQSYQQGYKNQNQQQQQNQQNYYNPNKNYSFNKNHTIENSNSLLECQPFNDPMMSLSSIDTLEPLSPHLSKKFVEIIVRESNDSKIQKKQQEQQEDLLMDEDSEFHDIENFDDLDIEPPIEELPFNCCICSKPDKNPLSVMCNLSQLKELTVEVNVEFWYYNFLISFEDVDVNQICIFHICSNCSKLFKKQVIKSKNNDIYKYILISSKITL
jgi:hypothetical protein